MRWTRPASIGLLTSVAALGLAVSAAPGQPASAQAPPRERPVTPFVNNWTRASYWRFFEPPPGGGDPTYADVANRLQIGLRRRGARYDLMAALQYVQFGGLPTRASGPGPLGVGAIYFDHNRRRDSRQVYVRYLSLRLRDLGPGLTIQGGRLGYTSGAESPSGDAKIEAVKRQRVDSRLIGEFEWSLYQRGFDGGRVDWDRPAWRLTAAAMRSTQGGFEEAAGVPIDDIDLLIAALTFRPGRPLARTEWLGTVLEGSIDFRLTTQWSVNGYVGFIRGGDVVRRTFAGNWLVFAYAENVLQF